MDGQTGKKFKKILLQRTALQRQHACGENLLLMLLDEGTT